MAAQTQVVFDSRFREFTADIEQAVSVGLRKAATHGAEVAAKTTPLKGYRVEKIISNVSISSAKRSGSRFDVAIVWRDFRSMFFQFGTYKNRKKKLKRDRRSTSQQMGVRALRFMTRARKAALEVAIDKIREEMR